MGFIDSLGNFIVGFFLFWVIFASAVLVILTVMSVFESETPMMYILSSFGIVFSLGLFLYWLQEWNEPTHNYNKMKVLDKMLKDYVKNL